MSAARRVAAITGAAGGIGQALAVRLANDGFNIAIADVAGAEKTVELCAAAGAEAVAYRCDISQGENVAEFAVAVEQRFGHADALVANAGIYPVGRFVDTTWEEWRRVMAVNLDSTFHLLRTFLPGMISRQYGRVVAVASGTFHGGTPMLAAYTASKGGVIGLVRCVASEVGADGITINAIAPSLTRTPGTAAGPQGELGWFDAIREQQAIKRTALPDDVAGAVSFLVSDDAAFVTGQTLPVDGGLVMV